MYNGYRIYNGKPLRPIPSLTTCTSSPGAREPIFVAIPFDQLRKKGAMMQKTNVSHEKTKMNKTVRRRGLPYGCCSKSIYRGRVVRSVVPMSTGRKKVIRYQRRSKERELRAKANLCCQSGVKNLRGLQISLGEVFTRLEAGVECEFLLNNEIPTLVAFLFFSFTLSLRLCHDVLPI
jgi:hypothetical protein